MKTLAACGSRTAWLLTAAAKAAGAFVGAVIGWIEHSGAIAARVAEIEALSMALASARAEIADVRAENGMLKEDLRIEQVRARVLEAETKALSEVVVRDRARIEAETAIFARNIAGQPRDAGASGPFGSFG